MSSAYNPQSVLAALAALHGENSTQAQRLQAQQYCEQVKAQPQTCLQISLALLQMPNSSMDAGALATARHFALHALQHIIANNWNQLGEDEKSYIKAQILLITENSSTITGGVRFLKQTISRILTDVCLREWPQRWPTFLDTMLRISSQSPEGTELFALCLRNLAEEVTNIDPIVPEARRKEAQQALMTVLDQLMPFLTNSLRDCVALFARDKRVASSLHVCQSLLECICALLDWIPAKHVFENSLVPDLIANMVQPDLFETICDCLGQITGRKSSTLDAQYSNHVLAIWDAILNWIQTIQTTNKFAKQIEFLNKLVNILNNLTRTHIELLIPATTDALRTKFLTICGSLLNHPFQKITLVVLDLWVFVFRHQAATILKPEYRSGLITELLKISCIRLIKATPEDFDEQQMEGVEEYNQFFGQFRGSLLHLITLMAEMDPNLCFTVVRMRYDQLLSQPKPTDHLNKDGFVTTHTNRYLELEATGALLECLFRSVKSDRFKENPLFTTCEQLLQLLLSWTTDDPLIMTRRFHTLGMFHCVLLYKKNLFDANITTLVNGVSFRPPAYQNVPYAQLPEDLKACRRRAISSLITLGRRKEFALNNIPNAATNSEQGFFTLPLFEQLVQTVMQLLNTKAIAQVEQISLFEFLVLISQQLNNSGVQQQLFNFILADPVAKWTNAQMDSILTYDPSQGAKSPFMQLVGFHPEDQQILSNPAQNLPQTHRTQSKEMRSSIRFTLHTFMCVFKPLFVVSNSQSVLDLNAPASGAASPTSPPPLSNNMNECATLVSTHIFPKILPNLLKLLGNIYALRNDAMRSQLPAAMHGLWAPTADQLLNPNAASNSTASVPPPKNYHLMWDIRRWLDRVLDSAMTILLLATKSGSVYYESMSNPAIQFQYINCIYSNIRCMHLRELRTFIDKFLESMLNLCPPQMYQSVLIGGVSAGAAIPAGTTGVNTHTQILPSILKEIQARVQIGWEKIQSAKPGGSSGSAGSLADEIHDESELRELSRCISENFARTIELQYVVLHTKHQAMAAQTNAQPLQAAGGREAEREKERREKELKAIENSLLMQAPICQFLFTQHSLLEAFFSLHIYLVSVSDSNAIVRSVRLIHRLLPVAIAAATALAPPGSPGAGESLPIKLYERAFAECVRTLANAKQQVLESIEAEIIALIKDIYVALVLGNFSQQPRQVFLSLPGVEAKTVQGLEGILGTLCAEKKYRQAVRNFIDKAIKAPRIAMQSSGGANLSANTNPLDLVSHNVNANTSGRTGQQVQNLSERLILPPKPRSEVVDLSGVDSLFS